MPSDRMAAVERRRSQIERMFHPDPFCLRHRPALASPLRHSVRMFKDGFFIHEYTMPRVPPQIQDPASGSNNDGCDDLVLSVERWSMVEPWTPDGELQVTNQDDWDPFADDEDDTPEADASLSSSNTSDSDPFEFDEEKDDRTSSRTPSPADVDPHNPFDIINYLLEGMRGDQGSGLNDGSPMVAEDDHDVGPDWYLTPTGDVFPGLWEIIETLNSLKVPSPMPDPPKIMALPAQWTPTVHDPTVLPEIDEIDPSVMPLENKKSSIVR